MKKLLGILVLSLFLSSNAYSNTPVENFVFKKLFDEYSHCTVYYKFLARSNVHLFFEKGNDLYQFRKFYGHDGYFCYNLTKN